MEDEILSEGWPRWVVTEQAEKGTAGRGKITIRDSEPESEWCVLGETLGTATGRGEKYLQVLCGLNVTQDKVGMATEEARSSCKGQVLEGPLCHAQQIRSYSGSDEQPPKGFKPQKSVVRCAFVVPHSLCCCTFA